MVLFLTESEIRWLNVVFTLWLQDILAPLFLFSLIVRYHNLLRSDKCKIFQSLISIGGVSGDAILELYLLA